MFTNTRQLDPRLLNSPDQPNETNEAQFLQATKDPHFFGDEDQFGGAKLIYDRKLPFNFRFKEKSKEEWLLLILVTLP